MAQINYTTHKKISQALFGLTYALFLNFLFNNFNLSAVTNSCSVCIVGINMHF